MKRFIYLLAIVFSMKIAIAQQHALDYITNSYITPINEVKSISTWNIIRNTNSKNQFGYNEPYQYEELNKNASYYKIFYTENGLKEGALLINYRNIDVTDKDFNSGFNSYFKTLIVDENENDYTKEIIITTSIHAGYFFNNKDNEIEFLFYNKDKSGYLRATIQVNLTNQGKNNLARDFINKMNFK